MPDLLYFPETFRRPEAKVQVLKWIRDWPFPLEAKKSALTHWSKSFDVTLTAEDWKYAIPEEQ
jgi:hypothetical protein